MKLKTSNRIYLLLLTAFLLTSVASFAQNKGKKNPLKESKKEFFKTEEACRIGDQILLYQRCTGGWPKNIDMSVALSDSQKAKIQNDKSRLDDSTTDNGATTMQMIFLARLFQQTGKVEYRDAFRKAVDYLISGQYDNGGWPQFWPHNRGYQVAITYNDNAMVNTMKLLKNVASAKYPYGNGLTEESQRERALKSFNKGVECILATQIMVNGQPTVWCQQHDMITMKPVKARAFELASYCTLESAAITELLMKLDNPDERVKRAIRGAMAWFDKTKIMGMRLESFDNNGTQDRHLVKDANAAPIWARYYDFDKCEPFVCDRDGLPKRTLEEIGYERRNGYGWYNYQPAKLFDEYEEWKKVNE